MDIAAIVMSMTWPQFTKLLKALRMNRRQFLELDIPSLRLLKFEDQMKVYEITEDEFKCALQIVRAPGGNRTLGDQPPPEEILRSPNPKDILDDFSSFIITIWTRLESIAQNGVASQSEMIKKEPNK